jgi:hypothetical protein
MNKIVINVIVLAILLNYELIQSLIIMPVGIIFIIIVLQTIAISANTFLITTLSMYTYIRFAIWFDIGLLMYFGYGMRISGEHRKIDGQLLFMPCIEWKSKRREQMYAIK